MVAYQDIEAVVEVVVAVAVVGDKMDMSVEHQPLVQPSMVVVVAEDKTDNAVEELM